MTRRIADETPTDRHAARAAELAAAMAGAAARLPRNWPKKLRPACPAAEAHDRTGERNDA